MASKPPWRVFCESSLVFFVPASFSGYFYFKVIQKLLHQEKRLVRNRFISVSLILSWLLWVLTWTPKFVLGLLQLSEKPQNYTLGSILNGVLSYLVPTQTAIQILYSQLNPIMYLILLKKFGEYHTAVLTFFKHILFDDRIVNEDVGNSESRSEMTTKNPGKARKPKIQLLVLIITFAMLAAICHTALLFCIKVENSRKTNEQRIGEISKNMTRTTMFFKAETLQIDDVIFGEKAHAARIVCSENGGKLSFADRRCYFILSNGKPGLNFTQQSVKCEEKGAMVTYPRNAAEIKSIWEFFEAEKKEYRTYFFRRVSLHAGYKREQPVSGNYANFTSLDEKLKISPLVNKDMFHRTYLNVVSSTKPADLELHAVNPEKGPGLCFSKVLILAGCMPRSLKEFTICSRNF